MKGIKELDTITKEVERILEEFPNTRTSDQMLIMRYLLEKHPVTIYMKLELLTKYLVEHKISFESITRARRKIQKERPELKDEEVEIKRYEQQEIFSEWSK